MISKYVLDKRSLKDGEFWYARFYDESTKSYSIKRSLKLKCKDSKANIYDAGKIADSIMLELNNSSNIYLVSYVLSFWQEDSHYAKKKKYSDDSPLSKAYIKICHDAVVRHVLPFKSFKNLKVQDLTSGMLEDWKLWAIEKGAGKDQINSALKALSVAVRDLISRGDIIFKDPFQYVKKIKMKPREKGILTDKEENALLSLNYSDLRISTAICLAFTVGLRRGEIRGLLWKDIGFDNDTLDIKHNYIDSDGLKGCKCNSERIIPLPKKIKPMLLNLKSLSPYRSSKDFVFFSVDNRKRANNRKIPMSVNSIRTGFKKFLIKGGISLEDQRSRNLTLHSMRHNFVSKARLVLPSIIVQSLTGQKTPDILERYSHGNQIINFDDVRKKLNL